MSAARNIVVTEVYDKGRVVATVIPAYTDKNGQPTVQCLTPFCNGFSTGKTHHGHNQDCIHAKKLLYAIAYEERRGRRWFPEVEYMHAQDEAEARIEWLCSDAPQVILERRIVGIAPVVGYKAKDDNGDKLSV